MNRRNFLKFIGAASVGATVAYSFPSIIVPKNIDTINLITRREIYPELIEDFWFQNSPFMAYFRQQEIFDSVLETTNIIIKGKDYGQPDRRINDIYRSFINTL